MMYEIRRRNKERKTWSFYACTDVAENAFEIRNALMFYTGDTYAVFIGEKEIKNMEEAMRR